MKRIILTLVFLIMASMFYLKNDLPINIIGIQTESQHESLFKLRPSVSSYRIDGFDINTFDIELVDIDKKCYQTIKQSMSNGFADELYKPIAFSVSFHNIESTCKEYSDSIIYNNLRYPLFTILISKSPMAGYPEYSMFKDNSFIELIDGYYVYEKNEAIYSLEGHRVLYGSFQIDDVYIFTKSRLIEKVDQSLIFDFIENMKQIKNAIINE